MYCPINITAGTGEATCDLCQPHVICNLPETSSLHCAANPVHIKNEQKDSWVVKGFRLPFRQRHVHFLHSGNKRLWIWGCRVNYRSVWLPEGGSSAPDWQLAAELCPDVRCRNGQSSATSGPLWQTAPASSDVSPNMSHRDKNSLILTL